MLQKQYDFRYMTVNLGKGERGTLKRIHVADQEGKIISTKVAKEEIKDAIIEYNREHYTKVHNTNIYQDKIYKQLQIDSIRDKIIDGKLKRKDCDNDETYKFLKLLANPNNSNENRRF